MASSASARRRARAALTAALLATLAAAAPARADLFSPGALGKGHEHLEGLSKCTECHVAGQQLSQERCLGCHVELKDRVAKGQGFHGRIPAAERSCETCHHDHQGANFVMVEWGPAGRDRFDHAKTGTPLRGKHAKAACAKCHEPRLVADPTVRTLLEKRPGRTTFLGAPSACASCHFDEHRAQCGTDCKRCHDDLGWKPAKGFVHAKTTYPLTGKHAKVECAKCHPKRDDTTTAPGTFPAPVVPGSFVVYRPLPHARCTDCHKKDPHEGRFGQSCEGCHVTASWKELTGIGKERAFHQKSKYPLEGAHLEVACKACHGPWGAGEKAKFKGLAFKACTDCHADAHVGQLARAGRPAPACDACHTVAGWLPPRYELEQHQKTRYPLTAAHVAVACAGCHPRDERLAQKLPVAVRVRLATQRRPVKVSPVVLARTGTERCETCHKDPHGGQFKPRAAPSACLACHTAASWTALTFDHGRDSRFPLQGKHAKAACAACHPKQEDAPTRYRPLELACAGCHADPHAGQLARSKGGVSDCGRCHDATAWKPATKFAHAPPFTQYRLRGKHASPPLKCEACHKPTVVGGTTTVRYRPLPTQCEGCHADFHKGAFRGFVP